MNLSTKVKLNNGIEIPILGLGTYLMQSGEETISAVEHALKVGYRHIDTASMYQNEQEVGVAIRNSGIPRDEIFVTTKLWNTDQGYDKAMRAFDASMRRLDIEYIDLYLIHWPLPEFRKESWRALEEIYKNGSAKAIGVSNYTIRHLEELFGYADILPQVNQVEFSPFLYQKELLEFCKSSNIVLESYSPLVRGKKSKEPKLLTIADRYEKSWAQILIRWALEVGTVTLPKTSKLHRIEENANVFDFEIIPEDIKYLSKLDSGYRIAWNPSNVE